MKLSALFAGILFALMYRLAISAVPLLIRSNVHMGRVAQDESLIKAVRCGESQKVKNLLKQGANPNACDKQQNRTALGWAAYEGHSQIVKTLIASGANVNAINDSYRETALTLAANAKQMTAMEILIAHGANVNAGNKFHCTALMQAVASNNIRTARLLIGKGANVNARTSNGFTALMNAIQRPDIMKILIDHGADINAKCGDDGLTADGSTALIQAARSGDLAAIRLLLAYKAKLNVQNSGHMTALAWAKQEKNFAVVSLLKKAGAKE